VPTNNIASDRPNLPFNRDAFRLRLYFLQQRFGVCRVRLATSMPRSSMIFSLTD
jgi:hypothetical protein